MKLILICLLLFTSVLDSAGLSVEMQAIEITSNFNSGKTIPLKVTFELQNLGLTEFKTESVDISSDFLKYRIPSQEPRKIKALFYWDDRKYSSCVFWAEPDSKISINIDRNLQPTAVLQVETEELRKMALLESEISSLERLTTSKIQSVNYENRALREVESEIRLIRESLAGSVDSLYRLMIDTNRDNYLSLFALWAYSERPAENQRVRNIPDHIDSLLKQLKPKIRQLTSAHALLSKCNAARKWLPGKQMMLISLTDTIGQQVSTKKLSGTYHLVDFWATWCAPCRTEHGSLIRIYEKYNKLGFEIASISIDKESSRQNWLTAIKEDHVDKWLHLLDPEGIVKDALLIRYIPANLLIAPDGKIVARDLRGDQLESALEKIFNLSQKKSQ